MMVILAAIKVKLMKARCKGNNNALAELVFAMDTQLGRKALVR